MEEKIQALLIEVSGYAATNKQAVEEFRMKFISKKGALGDLFEELKTVPVEQRKNVGKVLNELKKAAEEKFSVLTETLEASSATTDIGLDLTLPPVSNKT